MAVTEVQHALAITSQNPDIDRDDLGDVDEILYSHTSSGRCFDEETRIIEQDER